MRGEYYVSQVYAGNASQILVSMRVFESSTRIDTNSLNKLKNAGKNSLLLT